MGRLRNQAKPQDAVIEARRQQAFELRRAGASYRSIARALGVTHETARKDVNAVLEQVNAQTQDVALEYRAIQIERLDALLLGVWPKAARGDVQAIDRVLKIEERRAKLLGLDAPAKTEISGADGAPLQIAIAPIDYRKVLTPLAPDEAGDANDE